MKCSVDGCERASYQVGMCSMHYQRLRRSGSTDKPKTKCGRPPVSAIPVLCSFDGCKNFAYAKGICKSHYNSKNGEHWYKNPFSKASVDIDQNTHNEKVRKTMRQNITIPVVFKGMNTCKR